MNNKEPSCKLKFYADLNETKNKRFTYSVHDVSHSIDLLNKFVHEGWKIRMAYFEMENGKSMPLKSILSTLDGDLSNVYAANKELERKLNEKLNFRF
jgi:hypothetical protein